MPAVDVRGGRVVRLKQGRLQDEQVYGADPVEVARHWERQGAARLHLVDLDAAIDGVAQAQVIEAVIRAVRIPVEVGGGVRTLAIALRHRECGADRVIFGTAAVSDPSVVQEAVRRFPEAVAVALDARAGRVTVAGWKETTVVSALELAEQVRAWGVRRVQYTDVVRDGTLQGPNVEATAQLARVTGLRVTAGGGVATLDDLVRLRDASPFVDEVIVGKALYDQRFSLAEATARAR